MLPASPIVILCFVPRLSAGVVQLLRAHAAHRADDDADDNVCWWGSWAIYLLANNHEPSKAKFIAADAEAVLKSIRADAGTSERTKEVAGDALKALGLQL
jgi:hypothetical protein